MFKLFKKKVIIDTNFLMIPGELGIDIFSEIDRLIDESYVLCIMEATQKELQKIVEKHRAKKKGFNAKLAYIMIHQKKIKVITHTEDYADDAIVSFASSKDCFVCTQDKELKNRLKNTKAKVIVLKQKKYLDFES